MLAAVWLLRRPLALLALGVVIAQSLAPLVSWLERRLPRIAAVLLVYLALLVVSAGIFYLIVPAVIDQATAVVDQLPALIDQLRSLLAPYSLPSGSDLTNTLIPQLAGASATLVSLPLAFFSSLFDIGLVVFISIYWLVQTPDILRFTLSLFPDERRTTRPLRSCRKWDGRWVGTSAAPR